MAHVDGKAASGSFTVRAWKGDFKTLLAFNLNQAGAKNLAGFSIAVKPGNGTPPYYLVNKLRYADPSAHAQVAGESEYSSANAPFRKFRWLHVPGSNHQGLAPFAGSYEYIVTPRYFDGHGHLTALDASLAATVTIAVEPFVSGNVALGFTRGYVQSQAYVDRFGSTMAIAPRNPPLQFPSNVVAGTNAQGQPFTYDEEWAWLGFTAHAKIADLLADVVADRGAYLDMFAYDLNEPRILDALLTIAGAGRMRLILDDSSEHHNKTGTKPEDEFAAKFPQKANLKRGHFARYAHDKVLIVYADAARTKPVRVLTGSTNFSVTGLYVNANHVLVFDDAIVAGRYAAVFQAAWDGNVKQPAFVATPDSINRWKYGSAKTPLTYFTFAPHSSAVAATALNYITARIDAEKSVNGGSVFFAVMEIDDKSPSPVWQTLDQLHTSTTVFSYGISDAPGGVSLYKSGLTGGVLVTGKPGAIALPPPFDQVPSTGTDHQIHHKFVVCGFSGADPTVFCGSSNLATGGEEQNGDNLLEIHDADIATAFTIEATALVDHYDFLDKYAAPGKPPADQRAAAAANGQFLDTNDAWTQSYFTPNDLHARDRELFGA